MQNQLEKYIIQNFTDMQLSADNFMLYPVRSTILNAIKTNVSLFGGTLLDIGCGVMPYRDLILQNKDVTHYLGMDLKSPAYHGHVVPDLLWDGLTIPMDNQTINTVLATEFLEHYHDTSRILIEIYRVLSSGGIFFGTVPFIWNLHEVPYDEYRFTPYSLKKHLVNAGFNNVEIRPLGGPDAAMAQMMGIWFYVAKFKGKGYLKWIFFVVIRWLMRRDKTFTEFDGQSNSLYNGLSFTAYK